MLARHVQYDIGLCADKRHALNREEIRNYLVKTETPDSSFKFPATTEGHQIRKFQLNWLERYKWLAYSKLKLGAFCKYCVLFAPDYGGFGSSQQLKTFVTVPLTKYKNALEDIKSHLTTQYHQFSEQKALEFIKNLDAKNSNSVDILLDKKKKEIMENNRKRLGPIVKTILFCSRNNLPLRGHRDSGDLKTEDKHDVALSGQEGVFRALLAFRMEAGDENLKWHFKTAPQNCTMISNTIQNEIIELIGQTVRSKIVKRVKKSKFFSIICDETVVASKIVQLTLCARYVDVDESVIREDFFGFIRLKSTTGKNVTEAIMEELTALDLDIAYLRGQGYDGGSNFSGKENGVQALISEKQPLAFYTHCFSHSLNLCVSKACEVQDIRNMLGTVSSVTDFFTRSAQRTQLLQDQIQTKAPEAKKNRLKTLCTTRWVEKHECVCTFAELLPYIVGALQELNNDRDSETSSKATQLISAMEKAEFLISLQVFTNINAPILTLSRTLQTREPQISSACAHVSNVIDLLLETRKNEASFDAIFEATEKIADDIGFELKLPRLYGRQKNRTNVRTENMTLPGYFRATIYYPFLDFMISFLGSRFKGKFLDILALEGLIRAHHSKYTVETIVKAAKIYENDLNGCSESELKQEIVLWHNNCKIDEFKEAQTAVEALQVISMKRINNFFPNITVLLQLFATIPVTSATAERTFSLLKRLKTYLRVNMSEPRLNGLALGNIHKEIEVSVEEIVDMFCQVKPRRLETLDWTAQ